MKRNQFTFYRSFYEAVMRLPKCQRLEMMLYIIRFALDGVMPENMTVQQEGQFLLIKPIISKARNRAKGGSVCGKTESGQYPLCNNNIEIEKEVEIENELEAEAEGFDSFWEQYPKKVGREEARQAWVRVRHEKDKIFSSLVLWCRYPGWLEQGGRFIPKAEKWLTEGWYLQDPPGVVPVGASGVLGQAEREALQQLLEED